MYRRASTIYMVSLLFLFVLGGCQDVNVNQNINTNGTDDHINKKITNESSNTVTTSFKGAIQVPSTVSVANLTATGPGGPIAVQLDPTVANEAEARRPAPAGRKWIGYKTTGPVQVGPGQFVTMSYDLQNVPAKDTAMELGDSLNGNFCCTVGMLRIGTDPSWVGVYIPTINIWGAIILLMILSTIAAIVIIKRQRATA